MFLRRALKYRFAINHNRKFPAPPKLLSGQLQPFRFDVESGRIFDGYTLDELYGNKIGYQHSPAVKAQMRKDTITVIMIFILGFALICHQHNLSNQQIEQFNELLKKRQSRVVELPEGLTNNLRRPIYRQNDCE